MIFAAELVQAWVLDDAVDNDDDVKDIAVDVVEDIVVVGGVGVVVISFEGILLLITLTIEGT